MCEYNRRREVDAGMRQLLRAKSPRPRAISDRKNHDGDSSPRASRCLSVPVEGVGAGVDAVDANGREHSLVPPSRASPTRGQSSFSRSAAKSSPTGSGGILRGAAQRLRISIDADAAGKLGKKASRGGPLLALPSPLQRWGEQAQVHADSEIGCDSLGCGVTNM